MANKKPKKREIVIGFIGNPNVGKSTIFNALTGLHQYVANWPGKTVEKKEGVLYNGNYVFKIIDLPGTYSLTAYTMEELVTRDFIILNRPDVVVDIADASNLERNLYLTLQAIELGAKNLVVALNMIDIAKQKGLSIDTEKLEKVLGVPIVPVIAIRNVGLNELVDTIKKVYSGEIKPSPFKIRYDDDVEQIISELQSVIESKNLDFVKHYSPRWLAIKLLEEDLQVQSLFEKADAEEVVVYSKKMAKQLKEKKGMDPFIYFANKKYELINNIIKEVVRKTSVQKESLSDKIDKIVMHPVIGIFVLFGIFFVVFEVTFTAAAPFQDLIDLGITMLGDWIALQLEAYNTPEWLIGLVVDGIITGVGSVFIFFPILFFFFISMALLEDSGYMSRIAVVMDRFMSKMGLHGKSFISLMLGFGCNVPAVMSARSLRDEHDRLLTIMLVPFVPCNARLGVMAFMIGVFFTGLQATLIMLSFVFASFLIIMVSGHMIKRFILKAPLSYLIIELPPYHKPNVKSILLYAWHHTKAFISKAGSIILAGSIVIWFLSAYPFNASSIEYTLIGLFGLAIEPFGRLIGLNWREIIALFFGFVAKEITLSTLVLLYADTSLEGQSLIGALRSALTLKQMITFLTVYAFYTPCLATVATIKKETNSYKWTVIALIYQLFIAVALGALVYYVLTFLGIH